MDLFGIIHLCNDMENGVNVVSPNFWNPCNVVVLSTHIKKNNIAKNIIDRLINKSSVGYLHNIGFYKELYKTPLNTRRTKSGYTYSPLTLIDFHDNVNTATTTITSCIQSHLTDNNLVEQLANVICELHDNVCSHGKSFGFSMAQVYTDRIEFAIADLGGGFLRVLQRAGVPEITTDLEAIQWCLQKNNTSTKYEKHDDFEQSLPEDFIGVSPMGANSRFRTEDNHQGLGLDFLVDLHKNFSDSKLQIASGKIGVEYRNGTIYKKDSNVKWEGVAINLTIPINKTPCYNTNISELDEILNKIG